MDSRAKRLVEIGDGLFSAQTPWNNLRQEIAELFYPIRSDFTRTLSIGEDFQTGLMDSYPVQARETLGNMPHAMVRQGDWFSVSTGDDELDEDPENMEWFDEAKEVMRKAMYAPGANFVSATIEGDHDYVTFGNAILSIEENASRNGLIYRAHHPRDVVWMFNGDNVIDHVQRAMVMTARNVCANKRWTPHPDVKKLATETPNVTIKIRHILMPTDEMYGDDKAMRRKYAGKPFVSLYVDVERCHILGESGSPSFNYVIPGWRKLNGIMYAFSPATLNCLPDSRMLQSLSRIILEQGEKAIDPPMVAKGEIFRDAVNLYAGGLTYVDLDDEKLQDVMQVLENRGQLGFGFEMKQDVRNLIAEAFLLNKLFLPDTKDMTAFETNARLDEVRRAALPFFGPYDSDYNLPICDVTFEALLNARAIPPPPEKLLGTDITFKFDGPLNTLEGRKTIASFQESIQIITAAASLGDQSILQQFDVKQMTKDAVHGTDPKPDWIVDEEKVAEAADQTAQADQLAQAAEIANAGAMTAKNVGEGAQALQAAGIV